MLIASLLIAACGLSTVLIVNASAKQSYASNSTFLISNVKYLSLYTHLRAHETVLDLVCRLLLEKKKKKKQQTQQTKKKKQQQNTSI